MLAFFPTSRSMNHFLRLHDDVVHSLLKTRVTLSPRKPRYNLELATGRQRLIVKLVSYGAIECSLIFLIKASPHDSLFGRHQLTTSAHRDCRYRMLLLLFVICVATSVIVPCISCVFLHLAFFGRVSAACHRCFLV